MSDSDYEDIKSSESHSQQEHKQPQQPIHNKYGCKHYKRKCHILSPCCQQYYHCRLCHDQDLDKKCHVEKMDRYSIMIIKCDECHHQQKPTDTCEHCGIQFSEYFCNVCVFYTSLDKPVYHCDDCRLCRVGRKDDYFHCGQCNGDFLNTFKSEHQNCRQGGFQQNCFLCLEYLFDSRQSCTKLDKCGHYVHLNCFNSYLRQGFQNCPICGQSLGKEPEEFIKKVDELIEQSKDKIPQELKDKKVQILCNNCMSKTQDVPFNFYGFKCGSCGSYNTKEYV